MSMYHNLFCGLHKSNWCGPYFLKPKIVISPNLGCKTRDHCIITYQSSVQKKWCGMSGIQYFRDNNNIIVISKMQCEENNGTLTILMP